MMDFSLYTIVSLAAFVFVATVGIILKILLCKKRKELDGLDGFVHKERQESLAKNLNDGWERL